MNSEPSKSSPSLQEPAAQKKASKKASRKQSRPANRNRNRRRNRILLLIALIAAAVAGFYLLFKALNPISLASEVYVAEYTESFNSKGNLKSVFLDSEDKVTFKGSVDKDKIGTYDAAYVYKGKEYPFLVEVKDTKGPELEVHDLTITTNENLTPRMFVTSCSDPSNYSLKMTGDDPKRREGSYEITITARDDYENETSKTVKLTRVNDTHPPVIENFTESIELLQGKPYPAEQLIITDDYDEKPSVHIDTSALNTEAPGSYPVTIRLIDHSGNEQTYSQTVTVKENPNYGKKLVYLTFEEGPSSQTDAILDALERNNVKATFFVTAEHPESADKIRKIADAGHSLGLMSYSYNPSAIYKSEDAYFKDLDKIFSLVREETGQDVKLIRFPEGSGNTVVPGTGIMSDLVRAVSQKGYMYCDWNADSNDWYDVNIDPNTLINTCLQHMTADQLVVRFHDSPDQSTTAQALDAIIQNYRDNGYSFEVIDETTILPHQVVMN